MRYRNHSKVVTSKIILTTSLIISSLLITEPIVFASNHISGKPVTIESVQQPPVKVSIDGQIQQYDQPAVIKDGHTLVPLRGIFEKLGATVKWNGADQSVTATKGDTTIKLWINSPSAVVNGSRVLLDAKAQLINSHTMVPLRFVSEALGAKVSWDGSTETALIQTVTTTKGQAQGSTTTQQSSTQQSTQQSGTQGTQTQISQSQLDGLMNKLTGNGSSTQTTQTTPTQSQTTASQQNIGGIKVQYGGHTYGSENQQQYDKVMALVKQSVDAHKNDPYYYYKGVDVNGGNSYVQYVKDYFNGQRFDGNYSNGANKNVALLQIDGDIGALVKAGIPKDVILKATVALQISGDLVGRVTDAHDYGTTSAYADLFQNRTGCVSDSYTYNAVFDAMGFNTNVLANDVHADPVVEINGHWFLIGGGAFAPITQHSIDANGQYWYSTWTNGK